MSHHRENPTLAARVQIVLSLELPLVHDRHEKIGGEDEQGSVEIGWRYAEDRKRMFIHLHHAALHAAIVLTMRMPICVGQDDIRCAVRTMLICGVEEIAGVRGYVQQ